MTARPIKSDEIPAYGAFLGRCFAEENWNAAFVEVLDNPASRAKVLRDDNTTWVEAYAERASAYVVDDLLGLVLFDVDGLISVEDFEEISRLAFANAVAGLTDDEQTLLTARKEELDKVANGTWMGELFPNGYGHIGVVAVNPSYRGNGVFGELMQVAIDAANARQIPLCLECYAEPLQAIYASRNFKLVKTFTSDSVPLSQYCMVRLPD